MTEVRAYPERGPLEASRFYWFFGLAGEGQTPFRIGSQCPRHQDPLMTEIKPRITRS